MARFLDFFELMVPQYLPLAISGSLLGAVITINDLPDLRFLILSLILIFVVGAFNSFNAIIDKHTDKINKPHRPLPTNRISESEALKFSIALYCLAVIFSALINFTLLIIVFISIVLTISYSHPIIELKKRLFLGTLVGGIFYGVLIPLSGWSLYNWHPMPLEIISFLFFLALSLAATKDFIDIPGDTFRGVKTLPVKFGVENSIFILFLFTTFSFLLLGYFIFENNLPEKYYLVLVFYPLFLINTNNFRYLVKNFSGPDKIFLQTIALVVIMQLTMTFLALV